MWTISRALARSTCLPVPEEDFSAECFSDGEPSALWKSTGTAVMSLWSGRMTETLRSSPYGTTCAHLTEGRGPDAVTSCVAAFRARTCHPSGTVPESGAASPASGASLPESPVRSGHGGFSLRTPPTSSSSGSTSSYRTLTRSGTMRNGNVSPRPSSEPPTSGTGYGYLPRRERPEYEETLERLRKLASHLAAGVNMFLPEKEFAFWPTPTRSDAKNTGVPSQLYRQYIPLSCRVRIMPDRTFYAGRGRSNPEFVEWLMGWPMGWTALRPLATGRFQSWRHGHSWTCMPGSGHDNEARAGGKA